jgi:peroxiredoxin
VAPHAALSTERDDPVQKPNRYCSRWLTFALLPLAGAALAIGASAQVGGKFHLEPTGARPAKLGYFPVAVKLSETRPAGITKEPHFAGTPKYGVFHVGDGPRSTHFLALDEPEGGAWKIYVDLNGDGDLTSSGDGAWSKFNNTPGRQMYGVNPYVVRASWGTPTHESSSGSYGVAFYRFVGRDVIFMYREAARLGSVRIGSKRHKALLVENDADALYSKPLKDDGKPAKGETTRPVWLMIDMKDDGKWGRPIDIRGPFKLGERSYVAGLSPDGYRLKLAATTRKAPEPPVEKVLLATGTPAPDFEAEAWGGGSVHLADFRGKMVILDFWATWCGPCQKSMPHVEKVYQSVKDKDVVVLGLCVSDEKPAYEKWMQEKKSTYHFKFAFDPGARSGKSISGDKFGVNGIPTTYVIDKDGKVAAAIVGYDDNDTRLEEALTKIGISAAAAE